MIYQLFLGSDTSFLLIMEAQKRGYDIFYYNPIDLEYDNNVLKAWGFFINVFDKMIHTLNILVRKRNLLILVIWM